MRINNGFQNEINEFAFRSFREIADQDYIAARMCYHNRLPFQFNWAGQQALEKYLKGILLYNRIPSIKARELGVENSIGHHLLSAYDLIKENEHIGLELGEEQLLSLEFFSEHGVNRYFNKKLDNDSIGVQELDELVSVIRPVCRAMWQYALPESNEGYLASSNIIKHPSKNSKYLRVGRHNALHVRSGYLEDVLDKKQAAQVHWEALTKNNLFFGERDDHDIEKSKFISWATPTNKLHPECIEELKKLVKLD